MQGFLFYLCHGSYGFQAWATLLVVLDLTMFFSTAAELKSRTSKVKPFEIFWSIHCSAKWPSMFYFITY